jgi:hypothetical protein
MKGALLRARALVPTARGSVGPKRVPLLECRFGYILVSLIRAVASHFSKVTTPACSKRRRVYSSGDEASLSRRSRRPDSTADLPHRVDGESWGEGW